MGLGGERQGRGVLKREARRRRIKVTPMKSRLAALVVLVITATIPLVAQRPGPTVADYAARREVPRAERWPGLVVGGAVTPTWLPDDRFWYRNQTLTGSEIVVVDPAKKARTAYPGLRGRAAWTAPRAHCRPADAGGVEAADAAGAAAVRSVLRQQAARGLARRHARRLRPRLEPLGARHGERPGEARSRPTA